MRRITGAFLMLAAMGGCQPQQVAVDDRSNQWNNRGRMQTTPSVVRGDTGDPSGDYRGWRGGMAGQFVNVGPGQTSGPTTGTATAAKPFPAGVPTAEPLQQVEFNGNQDLVQATAQGHPAAVAALTGHPAPPTLPPAVVAAPPVIPPPAPPVSAPPVAPQPPAPLEIIGGAGRSAPAVIDLEPKPVAVAVSSGVSTGAPELRLVNTRRFSLNFSVQDNGANQVTIDLWETRDGKTWKKCDQATLQPKAYVVEVKEDGVYGYTMVARANDDIRDTQPKLGDVPQVWVTVDATKPAVTLTGVELNLTSNPLKLIVRWTAADKNFGPRPLTLMYAENAEGPWLPLAANIENTGRYECPIPANLPKKAYLRAEATDLVGNNGSAQTTEVVRFDFAAPAVQVVPTAAVLPPPPQPTTPTIEMPRPKVILTSVQSSQGGKQD